MFDADAFMSQQATGPLSTRVPTCPEGEFVFKVVDTDKFVTFREINTERGPAHQCEVLCECLDEKVRETLGRQTVLVPYRAWLDTTPGGQIDTSEGKNVKLGQLKEALGQNDAGSIFSPLRGAGPFHGRVGQRSDKNNPEIKYAEIVRVSKIS